MLLVDVQKCYGLMMSNDIMSIEDVNRPERH